MTNSYFDSSSYTPLARITTARAEAIDAILAAITAGFDKLPSPTDLTNQVVTYNGVDTGTLNTFVVTTKYTLLAYADGVQTVFKANSTNSGASTVNVNAIGAVPLVDYAGNALTAAAVVQGMFVTARYDSSINSFRIVAPVVNVASVTVTYSVKASGTDTTPGTLTQKLTVTAAGGLSKTLNNGGANENLGLALDVNGMAASTNVVGTDTFPVYDATAAAMKKQTRANVVGKYGLILQAAQVAGFTAVAGNLYPCDTTAGAFTVALPAAATVGDVIAIALGGANVLTLNPNGLKLNGSTSNFIVISEQTLLLTYHSATRGWV